MKRACALYTSVVACLLAGSAHAANFTWNAPTGGLFSTGSNWTPPGPPGIPDFAFFELNNTYTVTYQGNVINLAHAMRNGNVTYQLSGSTLSLANATGLTVGDIAGNTARLNLVNGTLSGVIMVGAALGATGILTIGDDAVLSAGSSANTLAHTGIGTMSITAGGQYTGTGNFIIAASEQGNGTLTVSGTGAKFTSGFLGVGGAGTGAATFSSGATVTASSLTVGSLVGSSGSVTVSGGDTTFSTGLSAIIIGSAGEGAMSVSSGAAVTVGAVSLAAVGGSRGTLTLSGAGTTFRGAGIFNVGSAGSAAGFLDLSGGATLDTQAARIAAAGGGTGIASVSGNNTLWNATSLAVGGILGNNGGSGTLTIGPGATVNVAGTTEVRNSSGSLLALNGGTLSTGSFLRLGAFQFNDGTLHVRDIFHAAPAPAALILDGVTSSAQPTLRLSGSAFINNVTVLTIGLNHSGALILDGGRALHIGGNPISVGVTALSRGEITLSGPNTSLTTADTLALGGTSANPGGAGVLTINPGATLNANVLRIWDTDGTALNLAGGTLNVTALNTGLNPSRFHWTGGVLQINSPVVIGAATHLGAALSLPANATLAATVSLTNHGAIHLLNSHISGGPFTNNGLLSGYGSVTSAELLNNGTIAPSHTLAIDTGSDIQNHGNITLDSGASLHLLKSLQNHGTVELAGGSLLAPAASLINHPDGTLQGAGTVAAASFANSGLILATGGTLRFLNPFTSTGILQLADPAANLTGGAISNNGTLQGAGKISNALTNNGTIEVLGPAGSILNFTGALANNPSGLITAPQHTKILVTPGLPANAGVISLTGGTFDNNNQPMNNTGQISGHGTFRTGGAGLTNNGSITFTGGLSTINGHLTNNSGRTIEVRFNPALFTGNVTNNAGATFKTTDTTVTFAGTFTNNGAFLSDPSTNIFQGTVTNNPAALITGGPGDKFLFTGGAFANHGTYDHAGLLQSSVHVTNSGSFTQTGPQTWTLGSTFTNTNGSATFATNSGSPAATPLSVVVTGGAVHFTSHQNLQALAITGGTANIQAAATKTQTLTFGGNPNQWTGQLDLHANALLLPYTPAGRDAAIATLHSQLTSGRANGTWAGPGITSSTIPSTPSTALAFADNAHLGYTTFRGQPVDASTFILVPAHAGDATLNNIVDAFDLNILALNWQRPSGALWSNGDFTGDGKVDAFDLNVLATHWQFGTGGALHPSLESALATFPQFAGIPVPEPASAALLALAAAPLLARRRRTA